MVEPYQNSPALWADKLPKLRNDGNKYDRGHTLILGGYPKTGASRLAALAAARTGSGLTSIAVPSAAFSIYATALTSVMVTAADSQQDLQSLLSDSRFSTLLVGPGAGLGSRTRHGVLSMLQTGRAVVLDADALGEFEGDLQALTQAIHGPCVLTPHEGEFRRLFDFDGDRLARAKQAAQACNAVIVLKGSATVIASPDGTVAINTNAPANLATAGSGDVLSGIVCGLLAQGMDPFSAACAAVWVHGEAARQFGLGLIADDLPGLLPAVFQRMAG